MTLLERALAQLPGGAPTEPANLDAALDDLGARVTYVRTDRLFDGATDVTSLRPVIELAWVDRARSWSPLPRRSDATWQPAGSQLRPLPHHYDGRTRFTLAHEIGHVLLHRLSRTGTLPRLDHRSSEWMCNSIAAELLMPKPWFRRLVDEHVGLALVRHVALDAGVSTTAATFRARDLGVGIVAAFLRRENCGWGDPTWNGLARGIDLSLSPQSLGQLVRAPSGAVCEWNVVIPCPGHDHLFAGHVRTTERGALAIFTHVDGRRFSGNVQWRCSASS